MDSRQAQRIEERVAARAAAMSDEEAEAAVERAAEQRPFDARYSAAGLRGQAKGLRAFEDEAFQLACAIQAAGPLEQARR
jgi:hypothetical protein